LRLYDLRGVGSALEFGRRGKFVVARRTHRASILLAACFSNSSAGLPFRLRRPFLKRALSLLLVSLTAFGIYVFAAAPLLALHAAHEESDIQRVSITLTFWIATALVYPNLHKFAVWLVDKIFCAVPITPACAARLQKQSSNAIRSKMF
jgi:hypothetical protein